VACTVLDAGKTPSLIAAKDIEFEDSESDPPDPGGEESPPPLLHAVSTINKKTNNPDTRDKANVFVRN